MLIIVSDRSKGEGGHMPMKRTRGTEIRTARRMSDGILILKLPSWERALSGLKRDLSSVLKQRWANFRY